MIDNNIIQSLGAGSGIDSSNLTSQLVEIERAAPQARIDNNRETTEAQISDFGLLKSALATLQDAAKSLIEEEGLFSKSAAFTDSDALIPSGITPDVLTGSYAFEVLATAQSQSLSSTTFANTTDAVGQGTMTFNFGEWDTEVFTRDAVKAEKSIVIDSSNNTLAGLRDAINNGDFGVQASIVNNGTDDVLLMTAESGATNQLEITVDEGGDPADNLDATGLSRFIYNETANQLTQNQEGVDAQVEVNGLVINRSTNQIDDVVGGLTVDLLKSSPGEIINITVTDDKTFAETNIRSFVEAYNTFLEEMDTAFGIDEETGERGSLANDSLAKSVLSQMRTVISSEIPGLSDGNLTAVTNVGIRTEIDGTLTINEDDFSAALADNFEDIQKLFAPATSSTAADITVNSFGSQTVAGSYDVVVTTNPTKGGYTGIAITETFPLDTSAKDYTFTAAINGIESAELTLPSAIYADETALAEAIQSLMNSDETLIANNAAVVVEFDTDHFNFTSNRYGTQSVVSFSAVSAEFETDLGIQAINGTAGINVAGTVGGEVAFGLGNVLLPALGSDAEGLTMVVGENATTGTVSMSRGFSGEMDQLFDDFLSSTGLLTSKEATLTDKLSTFDSSQEQLDRRMDAYEERLLRQFIAMESILNSLNSSGSFLENLINTLPFTADN